MVAPLHPADESAGDGLSPATPGPSKGLDGTSDVGSKVSTPAPSDGSGEAGVAQRARTAGDPVVQRLILVAGLLIIFFLATVVSAIWLGVLNPPAPRTALEKELKLRESQVEAGSKDPEVWFKYITALVANRQYSKAQRMNDKAVRAGYEDPAKQWFVISEVKIALARGDFGAALDGTEAGMAALKKQKILDTIEYARTGKPTALTAEGLGDNYDRLVLLKAEALEKLKEPRDAIEALDEYLERNKTAADVLAWRGDLKADTGDKEGATADYKEALRFLPEDEDLAKKMREVGATND